MRAKDYYKLGIMFTIMVGVALFYNKKIFFGLPFHEIWGLVVGGILVLHVLPRTKFIKQLSKNLFNPKVRTLPKMGLLSSLFLLGMFVYILTTGLIISRILLPNPHLENRFFYSNTHKSIAYLSLVFLGIHTALYLPWLRNRLAALGVKISANNGNPMEIDFARKRIFAKLFFYLKYCVLVALVLHGIANMHATHYWQVISTLVTGQNVYQIIGKNHFGFWETLDKFLSLMILFTIISHYTLKISIFLHDPLLHLWESAHFTKQAKQSSRNSLK